MKQEMQGDELAGLVKRIERQHREEMVSVYSRAAAIAMLGLPLVIGLVVLLADVVDGGAIDLADIGKGVGTMLAVGAAFTVLYWLTFKIWARW